MEPSTYVETTSYPCWWEAMQSEMESIQKNGTWQLVDLPEGNKPIIDKWICKIKLGVDGHIKKLKPRLVAHNFEQKYEMDYEDTFAPTVEWGTIQSIVTLAA